MEREQKEEEGVSSKRGINIGTLGMARKGELKDNLMMSNDQLTLDLLWNKNISAPLMSSDSGICSTTNDEIFVENEVLIVNPNETQVADEESCAASSSPRYA
ncbi:unnamed protein product [Rotaria socialis]|uniref:Uncharacterized protein n=1 Tax=Rotaria socialis TaxID=392032 RepID=A0A821H2A2_9BILA|nr:unnamed protein product [Rotaria socialis]